MNLRRHKVSESTPTTRRRRSSSLLTSDELLLNIPIDLVIEIFSRLPLKSIARCRCVSNRWAAVLRRPDFTELFFAKSLTRPKLLFACRKQDKKEVIFFSTPQPQNLGEDASLIASSNDDHVSFSFESVGDICISVNGYFCISDEGMKTSSEVVLASVRSSRPFVVSGRSISFEMWILEDPERHEWSKRIFNIPPMCKDAASREILYFCWSD